MGHFSQGIGNIKRNNTIDFIHKSEVPLDRRVTYANMVSEYIPLKSDPYQVRLTVGDDHLEYHNDVASPAALLLETKLMLNSTISDASKGTHFLILDIKSFFLQTYRVDQSIRGSIQSIFYQKCVNNKI